MLISSFTCFSVIFCVTFKFLIFPNLKWTLKELWLQSFVVTYRFKRGYRQTYAWMYEGWRWWLNVEEFVFMSSQQKVLLTVSYMPGIRVLVETATKLGKWSRNMWRNCCCSNEEGIKSKLEKTSRDVKLWEILKEKQLANKEGRKSFQVALTAGDIDGFRRQWVLEWWDRVL